MYIHNLFPKSTKIMTWEFHRLKFEHINGGVYTLQLTLTHNHTLSFVTIKRVHSLFSTQHKESLLVVNIESETTHHVQTRHPLHLCSSLELHFNLCHSSYSWPWIQRGLLTLWGNFIPLLNFNPPYSLEPYIWITFFFVCGFFLLL